MRFVPHFRPKLEKLEDRSVPATVRFTSGILQLTNINSSTSFKITQTANNNFTVQDSGAPLAYAGVGKIVVLDNNVGRSITLDLGTFSYSGSVQINSNGGDDNVCIISNGGKIGGNVTINTGLGEMDKLQVGCGTGSGLMIGGSFRAIDTLGGSDELDLGNLTTTGPLSIGGDVSVSGYNNIVVTETVPVSIGGNMTVAIGNPNSSLSVFFGGNSGPGSGEQFTTVGGTLTIIGGNKNDQLVTRNMTVGRDMIVSLGDASNRDSTSMAPLNNKVQISVETTDPAGGGLGSVITSTTTTTIGGNFTYNGGNNQDALDLEGTVFRGNVTLNFGNTTDPRLATAGDLSQNKTCDKLFLDDRDNRNNLGNNGSIAGNLTINALGAFDGATHFDTEWPDPDNPLVIGFQTPVFGNVYINLGNGDAFIAFEEPSNSATNPGATVDGTLRYRSGTGSNFIGLYTRSVLKVDVLFGTAGNKEVRTPNSPVGDGLRLGGRILSLTPSTSTISIGDDTTVLSGFKTNF